MKGEEYLLNKLEKLPEFMDRNRNTGSKFANANHQLVPIYDMVENGLNRVLLGFATGAGKTLIPIEVAKKLHEKKENTKVLVIAPKQSIQENWDTETLNNHSANGFNVFRIENPNDVIPTNANFVVVNYDKLNCSNSSRYLELLSNYANGIDLLVCDEIHNIKNKNSKLSKNFSKIIEISKDKKFIGLSATLIPDRLKDAGMLLYSLNPNRYEHYRTKPFVIQDDPEALSEMRINGQIRFFSLDQVANFHKLPELNIIDPIKVEMTLESVDKYFKIYKNSFEVTKLTYLEIASIEAMLKSPDTMDYLSDRIRKGHCLNFFSHLVNRPKTAYSKFDLGVFNLLEQTLKKLGVKNMGIINGSVSERERLKIQREMNSGNLDTLLNQWACTSEGFNEVAGERTVDIIPLRSPFSPGTFNQIIGRSYRKGQKAPVNVLEFHPHSEDLIERIYNYVKDYVEKNGIKIKPSWEPTLFHEDCYNIRYSKEKKIYVVFEKGANEFEENEAMSNISSLADLGKFTKDRCIDKTKDKKMGFGEGPRSIVRFTGTDYDTGLKVNGDINGKDYDRRDILNKTPGKVNYFTAEMIEKFKELEGAKSDSWKIADLGSCSSAVFSQARLLKQAIEAYKYNRTPKWDNIVNIDGNGGHVKNSRNYLENKLWIETITEINSDEFSSKDLDLISKLIKDSDFMNSLDFKKANFVYDNFGHNYDVIIASQSLQYNNQTNNRDLEKIIMNVNHSLREEGHFVSILTGNNFKNSYTNVSDIKNLKIILNMYGFEVEKYAHIQGKNEGTVTISPFHYIHSIKKFEAPRSLVDIEIIPSVYDNIVQYVSGGSTNERFGKSNSKKKTTENSLNISSKFLDQHGQTLQY